MAGGDLEEHREERKYGNGSGDQRSPFERDRDRVLYSQEFRRLAGVTQVVHVGEGYPYHNRLTHSLKVAQVGRRLAEHLLGTHDSETVEEVGGLHPDVVETAALCHDLGHPPFGHPVERELDLRTRKKGVMQGFQGNAQSFRIVAKIAKHKPGAVKGLNLTRASLNAILKYPWARSVEEEAMQKWGYYTTENDEFEFARDLPIPGGASGERSVEAEIMDWADDMTYAIHDVADFYKAGMIPLGELVRDSRERREFLEAYDDEEGPVDWNPEEFLDEKVKNIGKLVGESSANPLLGPYKNTRGNRAALNFVSSKLVQRYLGLDSGLDVSVDPTENGGLFITPKLRQEVSLLKFLSKYYVFDDPALVSQRRGHREIVGELFNVLFEACDESSEYSSMIPYPFYEDIQKLWEEDLPENKEKRRRARIVADIIASLTERQTLNLYGRVTGRSPGSIRDQIIG